MEIIVLGCIEYVLCIMCIGGFNLEFIFFLFIRNFVYWIFVKMYSICVMFLKGIDYKCGIKI